MFVFLMITLLLCLGLALQADSDLTCSYIGIDLLADRNGDFDSDPTVTKNWNAAHGSWGKELQYVVDPLNKDNYCVKIEKDENTVTSYNPYIQQNFKVFPGASYEIKARIYSDQPENKGMAYFNLTFAAEDATNSGIVSLGEKAGSFKGDTDGEWQTVTCTFTVPAHRVNLYFAPRQQGIGYMYFDDISLKMIEAPNAIYIETDEVFYYADYTEKGIATVSLNVEAYPGMAGKNVTFSLKKGDEIIEDPLSVSTENNCATFYFSVDALGFGEEYQIVAQIDGYSDPRCTTSWKVYRYKRPECLDENGLYYRMKLNEETEELERTDEVVQPVFAYQYRSWQFETGKPNGIIIAQLAMQDDDGVYWPIEEQKAYLKAELDKAKDNDMMCMIALYRHGKPAGNAINAYVTEQIVKEFYNHEALFAWMVMDETFSKFAEPYEDLRNSYTTIRNIDPYHPVYLCEATIRLEEAGRYADILCVDPYPAPYTNDFSVYSAAATFPGERVSLAVEAVKGRKPVYSLLQAFRWDAHPNYFPSGNEMRNMLYQSLIAGASGVGYFKFDNAEYTYDTVVPTKVVYKDLDETGALWEAITEFSQNEQKDAFDAFVYNKYPIFSDVRENDYWAVSFIKDEVIHMVVLNRKKLNKLFLCRLKAMTGIKRSIHFLLDVLPEVRMEKFGEMRRL